MIGRGAELARLIGLIEEARAGHSAVVVVSGEPGIGKSTLLAAAADGLDDVTVLRVQGSEAESDLAWSGLLQLCRPLVPHLPQLPAHQADAVRAALALAPPVSPDRFTIGVATLNLLALAAERSPVVVLVDDSQWVDAASLTTIAFVARRLLEEGVVILFARRDEELPDLAAFESLPLGPLDRASSRQLLDPAVAEPVAERILAAADGNPLALRELVDVLSADELAGRAPLPDPLPAGPLLADAYCRRLAALPERSRLALLVAAVAASDSLPEIAAALAQVGTGLADLEPAERDGLVRVDQGRLSFWHPLARSATYGAAAGPDRRRAHRAHAAVLDPERDAQRRAWHLAASAEGFDEDAARALSAAADEAGGRGAWANAAHGFAEAARLTTDPELRSERLLLGALAAFESGAAERALELATSAADQATDPSVRASAQRVRARSLALGGRSGRVVDQLLEDAGAVEQINPALAAAMFVDAAAFAVEAVRPTVALCAACRARTLARSLGDGALLDMAEVAVGAALVARGDTNEGRPSLRRYEPLLDEAGLTSEVQGLLRAVASMLVWSEDFDEARALLVRLIDAGRRRSLPAVLPVVLGSLAILDFRTGRWSTARRWSSEAVELAEQTGQAALLPGALLQLGLVQACQGRAEASTAVAQALELLGTRPARRLRRHASTVLANLAVAQGRPHEVIELLEPHLADEVDPNPAATMWERDLAEAYALVGRHAEALAVLEPFETRAARADTPRALAAVARVRALLAPDDEIDGAFEKALTLVSARGTSFQAARTNLCWAQRLAAAGRRAEALERAREARGAFQELDAPGWLRQVDALLGSAVASESQVAARDDRLDGQEQAVAEAISAGRPVSEVAAAMFVSTQTVERHLGSALEKLGVASGDDLQRWWRDQSAPVTVVLLGRFAVGRGDDGLTPPPGQLATAVKVTALAGGAVHADVLIETLWPDTPPERGRTRLRNVLARLRRSSGELLVRSGEMVCLAPGVEVDAVCFEDEARAAALQRDDDPGGADELARRALSRYPGDLLPDSLYEPWATLPRERLRRYRVALLDQRADLAESRGALDDALVHLLEAIEAEPLAEDRYLRAIRLLVAQGRRGVATALFGRACQALDEIGLVPSDEMQAIGRDLEPGGDAG